MFGPFRLLSVMALTGAALALGPTQAEAQFGKRLKDAVKRTAEDKAIQKATEKERAWRRRSWRVVG